MEVDPGKPKGPREWMTTLSPNAWFMIGCVTLPKDGVRMLDDMNVYFSESDPR